MKKTIIIYYSKNGSNRFLANKIAERLNCDIEELKPRFNAHIFMVFGISFGNKNLRKDLSHYDRIILCGPIWMGKFIAPLKDFVKKHKKAISELVFATCCGSSFEQKDDKFGHGHVFKKINEELNDKCIHCEAFPITLVIPEDKRDDSETVMNTRLTDVNFEGEIFDRFNTFVQSISK